MQKDLAQQAILAALAGNWEVAVKINKKILKNFFDDIDALNRLARAYAELGDLPQAKKTAKKVLAIDKFNPIAQKALEKWKELKKGDRLKSVPTPASFFLEEPGKTKIAQLINLGAKEILAKLDSGDEVKLNPHGHRVSIVAQDGSYVGRLSDDVSAKLKKLLRIGNEYQVLIKSCKPNEVKVFIRQTKCSSRSSSSYSFPSEKVDYISFTPPELIHKREETLVLEEDLN